MTPPRDPVRRGAQPDPQPPPAPLAVLAAATGSIDLSAEPNVFLGRLADACSGSIASGGRARVRRPHPAELRGRPLRRPLPARPAQAPHRRPPRARCTSTASEPAATSTMQRQHARTRAATPTSSSSATSTHPTRPAAATAACRSGCQQLIVYELSWYLVGGRAPSARRPGAAGPGADVPRAPRPRSLRRARSGGRRPAPGARAWTRSGSTSWPTRAGPSHGTRHVGDPDAARPADGPAAADLPVRRPAPDEEVLEAGRPIGPPLAKTMPTTATSAGLLMHERILWLPDAPTSRSGWTAGRCAIRPEAPRTRAAPGRRVRGQGRGHRRAPSRRDGCRAWRAANPRRARRRARCALHAQRRSAPSASAMRGCSWTGSTTRTTTASGCSSTCARAAGHQRVVRPRARARPTGSASRPRPGHAPRRARVVRRGRC